MPVRKWRLTIIVATVVLASLAPRPALAQNPFMAAGNFIFLETDRLLLKHDRARLQADIDRDDADAVYRDLRRVRRVERRVELDRWNLRADLFFPNVADPLPPRAPAVPPNPMLIPHPQYPGFGYFASDPTYLYRLPQTAAPAGVAAGTAPTVATSERISIEIVNAGRSGTTIDYAIDGVAYRTEGGQHQRLVVGPASTITYDRGNSLGEQRYALLAGIYEFRPADSGWSLVRLRREP